MYFSAYKCGQFSNFAQRRNQEWKTDVVYETEGPSGTFTSFEIKLQGYYHRARYQSLWFRGVRPDVCAGDAAKGESKLLTKG